MNDRPTYRSRLDEILRPDGRRAPSPNKKGEDVEEVEIASAPFGYLRGIRDFVSAIEFRFQNGNRTWFSYNLLGHWRYDPSVGLMLKFNGDVLYVVLIRGSNLDKPLSDGAIDLTAAIQRHRATWIREMSEEENRKAGDSGPTIDSIQISEFTSNEAMREWLTTTAPGFVR
jgi:hypothetical protein